MDNREQPVLQILAGVNGAGKSTLYEQALDKSFPFINADLIAKQIAPTDVNNPQVSVQAGREALRQIQQAFDNNQSFTFETTLSSRQSLNTIQMAKDRGYRIELYYVGLANREMSAERVASRVNEGGHDIPGDALIRRFDKSMANLSKAISQSDLVVIYDNSRQQRDIIYKQVDNRMVSRAENLPDWADTAIKKYEILSFYNKELQAEAEQRGIKIDTVSGMIEKKILAASREETLKMHGDTFLQKNLGKDSAKKIPEPEP